MNNNVSKENDSKKIVTMIIMVCVLMLCTTGATYAYFAINAEAVNNITGVAASGNIQFSVTPTLVSPSSTYADKPMVPQYAYYNSKNVLQSAVTGGNPNGSATAVPCVDGNGNVVCRVYTFTIKNNATASVNIAGTIKFTFTDAMPNLKWAPMSSATTVVALTSASDTDIHAASTTAATFYGGDGTTSSYQLAPSGTQQFWVVFWINETGAAQTDSGTWYATLTFTEANGKGITSTIVS